VARIEIIGPMTRDVLPLEGDRLSIGSGESSDLVLSADRAISRVHVLFENIAGGWTVRDVGSRNGTFVNTARLIGERPLRDGDEIVLGHTRLIFRDPASRPSPTTETLDPPPVLTQRERDVLIELCRPVLMGNAFTAPPTVSEMAASLVVTAAAVKQHLGRLYEKFDIPAGDGDRRAQLANAALGRGAVTMADLRGATR